MMLRRSRFGFLPTINRNSTIVGRGIRAPNVDVATTRQLSSSHSQLAQTTQCSAMTDNSNPLRQEEKEGEVPMVYLKPWAPQPTLTFRGSVDTTIEKHIRVINLEREEEKLVKLYKQPGKEIGLVIDKTTYFVLPARSARDIKLLWSPRQSGHWEASLMFEDDKARKGGVVLVFEATVVKPLSKPKSPLSQRNKITHTSSTPDNNTNNSSVSEPKIESGNNNKLLNSTFLPECTVVKISPGKLKSTGVPKSGLKL